mgnify:CR=1 FL=1
MKNINEILKDLGITVPEDKAAELQKLVAENYKTVAEFDKKVGRLETERDGLQSQLDTAAETLKKFEGIDADQIKAELAAATKKAEDAEQSLKDQLEERDYNDALKACMAEVKFSSNAARDAILAKIRQQGLKRDGDKLLGFEDAIKAAREADPEAFAKEEDPNTLPAAKVTTKLGGGQTGKKYNSKDEIMAIKDPSERQQAIAENMNLFQKG